MNEKIKTVLNIIGVYIGAGLLAYILSPLGGMFHRLFWKFKGCSLMSFGCDKNALFDGFIYLFIYLLAVFSFSVLRQKTAWKVYIVGTFLFWLFYTYDIIVERYTRQDSVGALIIMLSALAFGYGTGIGIRALINKMKKTK